MLCHWLTVYTSSDDFQERDKAKFDFLNPRPISDIFRDGDQRLKALARDDNSGDLEVVNSELAFGLLNEFLACESKIVKVVFW
jgi:hypothetical protein